MTTQTCLVHCPLLEDRCQKVKHKFIKQKMHIGAESTLKHRLNSNVSGGSCDFCSSSTASPTLPLGALPPVVSFHSAPKPQGGYQVRF